MTQPTDPRPAAAYITHEQAERDLAKPLTQPAAQPAMPPKPERVACIRGDERDTASTWGTIDFKPGTAEPVLDTKTLVDVCRLSDALSLYAALEQSRRDVERLTKRLAEIEAGSEREAEAQEWRIGRDNDGDPGIFVKDQHGYVIAHFFDFDPSRGGVAALLGPDTEATLRVAKVRKDG